MTSSKGLTYGLIAAVVLVGGGLAAWGAGAFDSTPADDDQGTTPITNSPVVDKTSGGGGCCPMTGDVKSGAVIDASSEAKGSCPVTGMSADLAADKADSCGSDGACGDKKKDGCSDCTGGCEEPCGDGPCGGQKKDACGGGCSSEKSAAGSQ